MLATGLGPWWLMVYPLVPLVGWSRVALRDHTIAQTIVGALVGAATAGVAFAVLR
ncbi:phosphatase PAP2 family protein [Streptomyces sp. S186]|uniref:phosphatase PAP2 family protein n=1 Tax=Streptomyces sp. S186 TaxID=3434395 RepID=UPI003F6711AC